MIVAIHGDPSPVTLVVSEKFPRYSTGIVMFLGTGATVAIDGPVTGGDIYRTVGSGAAISVGSVSVVTYEAATITIGSGCPIAEEVFVSTSNIHPVFDVATGARIDPAADIRIGDRVRLGARAMVMTGVSIGHDSVIGAGSIVTGAFGPDSLVGGDPARLIRSGVRWSHRGAERDRHGKGSSPVSQPRRPPCPPARPSPSPSPSCWRDRPTPRR